jgi:hypothetical protein
MMIMRFHRLIQSRLLWLFFLGIVVVSFVFMQAASDSDTGNPTVGRLRQTMGHINGEPVDFQRFDSTRRILSRSVGRRISSEDLDQMVWDRLTLLAFAESSGLQTPVALARRQFAMEFVGTDGKVDSARIQDFRDSLRGDNLSEEDYVRFFQDDATLQILQSAFGSYALVSPFDAERWASLLSERFEIEYASVEDEHIKEPVTVAEEQLVSFYQSHQDRFGIPEKRRVRYFSVPVEAFKADIPVPTEEQIRAEYDANPDRFTRFVPQAEGQPPLREPLPFEEAKTTIQNQLIHQAARKKAEELAMSYSVRLTPRRGRPAATLEEIAAEAKLEIQTTPPFSARDPLPGMRNARAFAQAVFELDETPIGRNGQPVASPDAVHVLQLLEIIPARPSVLEEVRPDVAIAATNHFRRVALNTLSTNLVAEVKTETAAGAVFKEALESRGLKVVTPPAFQLKDVNNSNPLLPPGLPQTASAFGKGEIFGPVESMYGGIYLGRVIQRTPVPEDAAILRGQLQAQLGPEIQFRGFFERFRAQVLREGLKIATND